ncbi:M56 family metallopeptidase [Massilia antarctica]|uniref:M56 family metallopeptidase n=1 Tax=Massilia antarctica TaxID=2765360 RepID=UPI0006BB986D|nr:M56 family metallopeptidase [Massilia sp. H27-R4]MCY0912495.1 M56 family metallopeptidase [Massilia sp. H27-R4]CUI03541.1 Ferric siderophore transport system, periplasmic binding protein TonB [Janthinobacterium sp. CG23_2]CUU27327.1 Ferric siderophore transport system, periplasmic binding protein TonB [Janthinobacterium sp. CG23_2]
MTDALIDSIGWTLLHFTWQGLLIGCACATALSLMRNARPEYRYNVACAALLACVLWPAADLALRLQDGAAGTAHIGLAGRMAAAARSGDTSLAGWLQEQLLWIVGFWSVCAALLSLRMASGLVWVRHAARAPLAGPQWQADAARMALAFGITRTVRLRVAEHLDSPLTVGWLRPVVLVPAALMSGMPPELLEALLAHEMGHVKRFDYLVNLGQNVAEILLFYHPVVWWISGRIRAERELIADDLAARHLGEPRRLARALSELERLQFSSHHLAMAANGGDLVARVRRLVKPGRQALGWKASLPALGLAAACLSLYAHAAAARSSVAPAVARVAPVVDFSSCAKPVWPAASLKAQHTGTVTLAFKVGANGRVAAARVASSSGHVLLDDAARTGIMKCQFKPGSENGKPVPAWMHMEYVWMLADGDD